MILNRSSSQFLDGVKKRCLIFLSLVVFAFLVLAFRIWDLQIIRGNDFKILSENNRIRQLSVPGYRGNIFDRNKEVLVSIRPSFNLYIVPEDVKNIDDVLELLGTKLKIEKDKIKADIKSALPFQNVLIKRSIRRDIVAFIEEHNIDLPGVRLIVEPLRSYKNKDLASTVLGYISEISRTQLNRLKRSDYKLGDFIGKYGIEKKYENILKGKKGLKAIEVDASGRELSTLKSIDPKPGRSLVLTLDANLQSTAERLLKKTKRTGSVVVTDPNSGEILAMVSEPSFDPNLFASGISSSEWSKIIKDERHPLSNRAIQGQFPPASTYKIVVATAGLEEGIIDENTTFNCPGYFKHGKRLYRCWKKHGHGKINVRKALMRSCDVFFYQLGIQLGVDTIAKYAKKFGLGKLTGLKLQNEKSGLIPTRAWKKRVKNESWMSGETVSASVGQGYDLVTPLQMSYLIGAVANGGTLWAPKLLKKIEDINGNLIEKFPSVVSKKIGVSSHTLNIVRESLLNVVNKRGGTGWRARLKKIKVSGKTGTAQVVRLKDDDEEKNTEKKEIPVKFRDHAWFVAFAPFKKPELAIAVIVEHGGHGGSAAAPIAKGIVKAYYKNRKLPLSEEEIKHKPSESKKGNAVIQLIKKDNNGND